MTNDTTLCEYSPQTVKGPVLYMGMELSKKDWKLALSDGGGKIRVRTCPAREIETLMAEIARAKETFGLAEETPVLSCYEAGYDGFWIDRMLEARGIHNIVVDPGSIEVNRRARRPKTDPLDARMLVRRLVRYYAGDAKMWSVVRVPTSEQEDLRRPHRERECLVRERTRHRNRIRALLMLHGIVPKRGLPSLLKRLDEVYLWDGSPLPPHARAEIERHRDRLDLVSHHIETIEEEQEERLEDPQSDPLKKMKALTLLCGIGPRSAWLLVTEFFGWRRFPNRREVGSAAGLVSSPFNTGQTDREQGISKAGNRRVRGAMIQLAWLWIRNQPQSKLARWFESRYANESKRMRRIGIVAVARQLLVALWQYVEHGVVPEGARLKQL